MKVPKGKVVYYGRHKIKEGKELPQNILLESNEVVTKKKPVKQYSKKR